MAVANEADKGRVAGTVFTPRQVRALKIAVIVMGILLAGGFALVLATIVYQASRGGEGTTPSTSLTEMKIDLAIPKDASVTSLSLDGDRLALHLSSAQGAEIVVVDLTNGKVVSRVELQPQ